MSKTLSRLIREYVSQHPGCKFEPLYCRLGDENAVAREISRLISEQELNVVNGRLYISSVRNVASSVG